MLCLACLFLASRCGGWLLVSLEWLLLPFFCIKLERPLRSLRAEGECEKIKNKILSLARAVVLVAAGAVGAAVGAVGAVAVGAVGAVGAASR